MYSTGCSKQSYNIFVNNYYASGNNNQNNQNRNLINNTNNNTPSTSTNPNNTNSSNLNSFNRPCFTRSNVNSRMDYLYNVNKQTTDEKHLIPNPKQKPLGARNPFISQIKIC